MHRYIARLAPVVLVFVAACSRPSGLQRAPQRDVAAEEAAQRSTTRSTLAVHRAQQLERLHAYAEAGQFPHDLTVAPSLHMFRDADGRYCAVANLVHQDGRDDLVEATVRERNDLAIADVSDGPMMDWVLGSGLTQEELARIQLPAPVMMPQVKPRVNPVAKVEAPKPAGMTEAQMIATVRAHVAEVERELRANESASLDAAVTRYMAVRVNALALGPKS